ncbi:Crp/Fnr family transcriptional regulator [Flavobacterium sp.]|uniref:Crp/Fnr family transcriptional regulator n=1 Tax=unclassified Flavobacterium TaxID=196869 RepID=UPI0025C37636|nr:Crp/Fnr family transcriptional regulator [Flavobacterium sp.]
MESFNFFLNSITPISNQEFENYSQYFKSHRLPKNSYFALQGKICQEVAFIKKGTLRTYYTNEKSEEITSCFCTENNLTTSYKSFVSQQPSDLSIQAIEDTELLVITYADLQNLYRQSNFWQNIGRVIAERQYMVMEQYASVLCNETAKEKYLRLLKEHPSILNKGSINDIATYLGVTRRTLSRIRKEITVN